jgi:hypothetical protein
VIVPWKGMMKMNMENKESLKEYMLKEIEIIRTS